MLSELEDVLSVSIMTPLCTMWGSLLRISREESNCAIRFHVEQVENGEMMQFTLNPAGSAEVNKIPRILQNLLMRVKMMSPISTV